jgi:diacylglycerol O-acyltransferase / wax synthase
MHRLNTIDSLFLYMDQRGAGMHGTMLQIYAPDGKKQDVDQRYKKIVARLEEALPFIPLLHQKVYRVPGNADKPYWVAEKDIDLDYHVRRVSLPAPGNWDQLTEFFGRVCATSMNLEQPLWQVVVVEGLDAIEGLPRGSYAIMTKMHHAAADGMTGTQVTSVIAGAPISVASGDGSTAEDLVPSLPRLLVNSVSSHFQLSMNLGREYLAGLPAAASWIWRRISSKPESDRIKIPDTRFNGSLSPDRAFDCVNFDLSDFESIRKRVGSITVNDIVLTVCAGALREFLEEQGELPQESVVAVMPISVRQDEVGGNQFGVGRVVLHTNIKSPVERLRKIHQESLQSKEQMKEPGGNKIAELGRLVPEYLLAGLLKRAVRYRLVEKMPPLANCLITNVAGPPREIRSDDSRLAYMTGAPPIMNGLGLEFPVLSYNGTIAIAIISCKKMLPDKARMVACIRNSFALLQDEVDAQFPPRAKRAKPARKRA